jgi:hypothetical protein
VRQRDGECGRTGGYEATCGQTSRAEELTSRAEELTIHNSRGARFISGPYDSRAKGEIAAARRHNSNFVSPPHTLGTYPKYLTEK